MTFVQKGKGQETIPGPNYLYSLNGYDKFERMVSSMDAHVRYIIWVCVGISNNKNFIFFDSSEMY